MRPTALLLLASLAIVLMLPGCGGDANRDNVVVIQDFDFDPTQLTVATGTTVRWSNVDNQTHSIVSGALEPTIFPDTVDVDLLDTGFDFVDSNNDGELDISLGDSVRFRNLSNLPRQPEVKNQDFEVVFLSPELNTNGNAIWTSDAAGVFDVRDVRNPSLTMRIVIEGTPDPDGLFNSGVIVPAADFEFTFTTPGTFPYFCGVHNIEEGTVVVQP